MRYLFLTILIIVLSSCSLWPWRSEKTGTCLDDDSCEDADPLSRKLVGGTWYCYGSDRDQPWDCSQNSDDQKIISIPAERNFQSPPEKKSEIRTTEQIEEKQSELLEQGNQSWNSPQLSMDDLSSLSDDSYAIQLIALQTMEGVEAFIMKHNLISSKTVMIRSEGEDLYAVILGIYESESRAQTLANEWQAKHNPSSTPWVRNLGPLKRAMVGK